MKAVLLAALVASAGLGSAAAQDAAPPGQQPPIAQPDGNAPIYPQPADPAAAAGSQEVLHAPSQQLAPNSTGGEKAAAPTGGAPQEGSTPKQAPSTR